MKYFEALDRPKQFCGTSVVVKTDQDAKHMIVSSVKAGWEPHFVVIYGNVSRELAMLARMPGVETCMY